MTWLDFALGAVAGVAVTSVIAHAVIQRALSAQLEASLGGIRNIVLDHRQMSEPEAEERFLK